MQTTTWHKPHKTWQAYMPSRTCQVRFGRAAKTNMAYLPSTTQQEHAKSYLASCQLDKFCFCARPPGAVYGDEYSHQATTLSDAKQGEHQWTDNGRNRISGQTSLTEHVFDVVCWRHWKALKEQSKGRKKMKAAML
jgi:hypothetical protein